MAAVPPERREHFSELARRSNRARRVRSLEDHILRVVTSAPPPTPEDRDRLASLLRTPDSRGGRT